MTFKLGKEIVALSVAQTWDEARLEWRIEEIYWESTPDTCLCGHFSVHSRIRCDHLVRFGQFRMG